MPSDNQRVTKSQLIEFLYSLLVCFSGDQWLASKLSKLDGSKFVTHFSLLQTLSIQTSSLLLSEESSPSSGISNTICLDSNHPSALDPKRTKRNYDSAFVTKVLLLKERVQKEGDRTVLVRKD